MYIYFLKLNAVCINKQCGHVKTDYIVLNIIKVHFCGRQNKYLLVLQEL